MFNQYKSKSAIALLVSHKVLAHGEYVVVSTEAVVCLTEADNARVYRYEKNRDVTRLTISAYKTNEFPEDLITKVPAGFYHLELNSRDESTRFADTFVCDEGIYNVYRSGRRLSTPIYVCQETPDKQIRLKRKP